MTLIDNILKWFKAPKTLYGIAGMIVIIIVLALDFAYWAGAIEVGSTGSGSGENGEGEEVEIPDDYLDAFSDNLERGSYRRPMIPDPRGEEEGVTYKLYAFPIEINRSEITITSDGDPGSPPRGDGGDRNDIDLYIYRPGNDASGDLDTTTPDYQAASPYIAEIFNDEDLDPGNWTLRVDCYTGSNVQYDIEIVVIYTRGNETDEGE